MTSLPAFCAAALCVTQGFSPAMSVRSLPASQARVGESVVERDRHEALQRYRAGQSALRNERFVEAESEFQQAAKLDPTLELAPYGLGQVYMATKRYRPAIVAYQRSRELFQANTATIAGDDMSRLRRIEDQIKELEDQKRLLQASPGRNAGSPAVQANIRRLDDVIREMQDLRHRTQSGPAPTPAWISLALGSAYFRVDEMAGAEREYRAAAAVDPKLGEAHNNLAVVCMMTGRYEEAEQEIKAAERAGFKVNPQLKEDLRKAAARR